MLTNDQIKDIVKNAFIPLGCVAQIWDYDHKIRFKVFDAEDNGIVEMPNIVAGDVRDEVHLRGILSAVREQVKGKGFMLDEWP